MAQANRPGDRVRENDAEGTPGTLAAVIARLVAKPFELDGPQPMGAQPAFGHDIDPRGFGKVGASLAKASQLFNKNMPHELRRHATQLRRVFFAAPLLGKQAYE